MPATAGTVFDKIRTPRTIWFATPWLMGNSKTGMSATRVQRELELGSYLTAGAMPRGDVEPVRVHRHEHWRGTRALGPRRSHLRSEPLLAITEIPHFRSSKFPRRVSYPRGS
ncbi:MAG: hypothetical protein ACYCZN_14665 [Candidatus Dormibacteria bacterium]